MQHLLLIKLEHRKGVLQITECVIFDYNISRQSEMIFIFLPPLAPLFIYTSRSVGVALFLASTVQFYWLPGCHT